jgi:hypothetical protein
MLKVKFVFNCDMGWFKLPTNSFCHAENNFESNRRFKVTGAVTARLTRADHCLLGVADCVLRIYPRMYEICSKTP